MCRFECCAAHLGGGHAVEGHAAGCINHKDDQGTGLARQPLAAHVPPLHIHLAQQPTYFINTFFFFSNLASCSLAQQPMRGVSSFA